MVMSSNYLFCLTNSPKSKEIHFIMLLKRKLSQIWINYYFLNNRWKNAHSNVNICWFSLASQLNKMKTSPRVLGNCAGHVSLFSDIFIDRTIIKTNICRFVAHLKKIKCQYCNDLDSGWYQNMFGISSFKKNDSKELLPVNIILVPNLNTVSAVSLSVSNKIVSLKMCF